MTNQRGELSEIGWQWGTPSRVPLLFETRSSTLSVYSTTGQLATSQLLLFPVLFLIQDSSCRDSWWSRARSAVISSGPASAELPFCKNALYPWLTWCASAVDSSFVSGNSYSLLQSFYIHTSFRSFGSTAFVGFLSIVAGLRPLLLVLLLPSQVLYFCWHIHSSFIPFLSLL